MITPNLKKMRITVDGKVYEVVVEMLSDALAANAGPSLAAVPPPAPAAPAMAPAAPAPTARPAAAAPAGAVTSPLAGTVITVHVKQGQAVQSGEVLVTLEAMKMNTPIRAQTAGTVREIYAQPGAAVEEGAALVLLG